MNFNLGGLLSGLSLNKIVSTANKTITFVNKAIPIYKQSKPLISNVKNIKNLFSKNNSENINENIKPIQKITNSVFNNKKEERNINDTLTFFQ